ncbi:hypothetical protein GC088_04825 [Arthrobacter sp. JZ12]|uniref:hypothetical protein n=1 Tax=Arthrobacter sp. JZ12 TaxID=2654190 RepID=UPI002B46EED5|nr:hypothetical protein [Arthrobacter sp. JZ12]WRH24473.1 hypothetical protein GC088_04825 [Arthrobacter sp. JZ12]
MRTATAIRTALAVVVAVVLGLLVAPASHALWSVFVPSNAGTIQAADFSVPLTGYPSNLSQEMALADGTPATLSLTGTQVPQLSPGASATAGVLIKNNTNAGSEFTIRVSATSQAAVTGALAGYVSVGYGTAADLAGCATTTYTAALPAAIDIPKGGSAVRCFKVELASAAPASALGQSATISVNLNAAQIGRTP